MAVETLHHSSEPLTACHEKVRSLAASYHPEHRARRHPPMGMRVPAYTSLALPQSLRTCRGGAAGQQGLVWFLGGQFGETSPNCTIPHGKAVLVPIVNGECS